MSTKRFCTEAPQRPVREVITERIALRVGRRLRKEAGRGLDERAKYLALALKYVRAGDVPAPRKTLSTKKPVVNEGHNPYKGMKRKHRLRIKHRHRLLVKPKKHRLVATIAPTRRSPSGSLESSPRGWRTDLWIPRVAMATGCK